MNCKLAHMHSADVRRITEQSLFGSGKFTVTTVKPVFLNGVPEPLCLLDLKKSNHGVKLQVRQKTDPDQDRGNLEQWQKLN